MIDIVVEPTLMAESLINVLASAGLALVARANQRIDPHGWWPSVSLLFPASSASSSL